MLPTITVIGNVKRMETKTTQSGKTFTKFQVSCAEKNTKGEWINLYIDGEVWDKASEFMTKFFKDGSSIIVTGKLYTNVYQKQDNTKVYQNKLLFPNISFAPKDKEDNGQPEPQQNYQPQPQNYQPQAGSKKLQPLPSFDDVNNFDDDIPF